MKFLNFCFGVYFKKGLNIICASVSKDNSLSLKKSSLILILSSSNLKFNLKFDFNIFPLRLPSFNHPLSNSIIFSLADIPVSKILKSILLKSSFKLILNFLLKISPFIIFFYNHN